jgi:hypothetical protein
MGPPPISTSAADPAQRGGGAGVGVDWVTGDLADVGLDGGGDACATCRGGVTGLLCADSRLLPMMLVANTVKV